MLNHEAEAARIGGSMSTSMLESGEGVAAQSASKDAARSPWRHGATDIDQELGTRVRKRRVLRGLTQGELADALGVTHQQAHKYERGINRMTPARLVAVAATLGTSVGQLFRDLGPPLATDENEREVLELVRSYLALGPQQRDAVRAVLRAMA